jgi:hypothetical protein
VIVSAGMDHTLGIWYPFAGKLAGLLYGHKGPVVSVAMDETRGYILSISFDEMIRSGVFQFFLLWIASAAHTFCRCGSF